MNQVDRLLLTSLIMLMAIPVIASLSSDWQPTIRVTPSIERI